MGEGGGGWEEEGREGGREENTAKLILIEEPSPRGEKERVRAWVPHGVRFCQLRGWMVLGERCGSLIKRPAGIVDASSIAFCCAFRQ